MILPHVRRGIICKSQDLEATEVSNSGSVDEEEMA